jgi:hypothetical protein
MPNVHLIHPEHPVWKPVALADRECVPYLNKLFKLGWSLIPFDMDGIEWMMLSVPLKTPKKIGHRPNQVERIRAMREPHAHVVVLRHDARRDQFRAVLKERNE